MFRFGFELEGFYINDKNVVVMPPKEYPVDGFPGLVEIRTRGGESIRDAYGKLIADASNYNDVRFDLSSAMFDRNQLSELRRRYHVKEEADIQNLYGKMPRRLGNRIIASLQINISNRLLESFVDDKGVRHFDRYGLLDIPRIVRALDTSFANEIRQAGRQAGEYCVKEDIRLEYRSLPNSVFSFDPVKINDFIIKVEKAINNY